jgi:glycerol kinase
MKYILALDQGTTSSRAIVFDHAGSIVSAAQKEFPQLFPKPGWVEHESERVRLGHRRDRHNESARNNFGLGPRDG